MSARIELFNLRLNSVECGSGGDAVEDDLMPDFIFSGEKTQQPDNTKYCSTESTIKTTLFSTQMVVNYRVEELEQELLCCMMERLWADGELDLGWA